MLSYFQNLIKDPVALIGLLASIIVLVSMCFNARTVKGEFLMRVVNLIGSIVSVIYGVLLGPLGAGMILLNGTLVFVNLYYIFKSIQAKRNQVDKNYSDII